MSRALNARAVAHAAVAFAALLLCPVLSFASVSVQETLLTPDPLDQFDAAASGPITVFTDMRLGT